MPEPDLYQAVLAYHDGGRCVLPPVAKGAKYPSILNNDVVKAVQWKIHTERRPTPTQLKAWFGNGAHVGVALAGGFASGVTLDDGTRTAAEFLDIEDGDILSAFEALVRQRGYGALYDRLPREEPPRGGGHLGWQCTESAGNTKLAMRRVGVLPSGQPEIKTLIETRGEGGLLVVAPTPAGIHPDVPERGYVMVHGSWAEMPVISPEARHALLECAMALNEYIEPQPLKDADRPHDDPPEGSPGEDFNRRATQAEVRALLQRHGWSVDHSSQGTDFLRRPGKAEGYSATLGHVGPNILYVFSSNASPFQGPHGDHPGTAYKPFGVYGLLEFRGDFQDAARVLALSGYGATRNGHRPDVPEYIDDPPDTKDERDPWAGPGTDEAIHLTDVGNGLRLVQQFGVDLRYVTTWDKWLVWTKTRWQLNVGKRVEWHAKQVIGRLYQEAQAEIDQLMKEPDKSTPQYQERFAAVMQRLKWAHTSESGSHIDVMVKRARVNPRVQVLHDELDRQAYYLHVLNGTIDLRTGACRQPVRGDLITKCANVVYDPEAICPRWISFLQRVQGYPQSTDNLDEQTRNAWIQHADTMMTYLKRLVGMSLTGDVSAQLLPFLYGLGRNGKSTFLNTILQLTGEYGMQAPPNFLLARDREVHPTEQADLFSKRFISTIEVEKGKFLAESLMKMLTGGERIRARRMREDFWEFAPTWHIWLAANDKPRIRGRELATWRRIKLIPFAVQIPLDEVDPDLPLKLSEELPGILNWAIDGCLDWLAEHRLPEPEAVTKATEAYREESDLIQQFVQDCCKTHELARAQSGPLQKAFETYTGQTVNAVEFTELMRGAGYEKKVSGGRSYWLGLGLIVPQNNRGTDE